MRFFSRGHDAEATSENIHRYGSFPDGSRNTIHASGDISVEVDENGHPTAVWFRCLTLPFHVWQRNSGEPAHAHPDITILNIEYERKVDI